MATEANIQEIVCLKKGEREENALTSESFEEKVTELPGNQVKQLETSSLMATTVYTPLETGKPTDESGIFFQALSVTMVIAEEHSNTPESCKDAKQTEPEEETIEIEEKAIESEVCGEDVPVKSESEVGLKLLDSVEQSKKEAFNLSEKNQGDSDVVTSSQDAAYEDSKETPEEHAATMADFKEQDLNETPREFVKEETDDKSVDAQEATVQCEIGSKDTEEQKYEESVKKIEQGEEIKPDVETEKKEQNGLVQAIISDDGISTQTSKVETTEHEETEQDANVIDKDQDEDYFTRAQEVTFEGGLQEKNHRSKDNEHEVVKAKESIEEDADVCVSTQTTRVEESIKTEEPNDEKAIDPKKAELEEIIEISDSMAPIQKETLSAIEKDQGDSNGVTSSQESPCVDVEDSNTVQHVTTAIDFKEQDLNEKPRELNKEETEDKSLDAQEESEEGEKGAKEEIDQNPEESVKRIEKEEETANIKPGVEIEEKKEQNELLPAITTDVCITTQTESQVEKTEHEEEEIQNDGGLKETSDSPSIKEVCEETGPEKDEHEKEVKDSIEIVTQDENEREVVTAEESTQKDTEVIRSTEKTEQQMLINAIPADVCISTPTEPEEETTEKIAEEAVDGQANKSEEGLLFSDSSRKALDENETVRKDEDQEKEQEIYVTEKVQSGGDDVTSSENASNEQEQHTEEIKPSVQSTEEKDVCISTQIESREKAVQNEENAIKNDGDQKEKSDNPFVNEVCEENDLKKTDPEEEIKLADTSNVTTRESVDEATEETKSSDETKEYTEQQGVLNDITSDVFSSSQTENSEKTTASDENKEVETIEKDDGQTEKPERRLVEVLCETTRSETVESEEGVNQSDGFGTTLNENETPSKEETLEREDDIKTSEVQGGGDDVTSSQNASSEDIQDTTTGQDTNVDCVKEGPGVIAMPKEILTEEAEDKSVDAEELGQPNEQNVEETHPCLTKTVSQNPEDEIKKEDKDLSHEGVEETDDDSTKEEKCTLEQEGVEEHNDKDEVSEKKVTDLKETKEAEPKEQIISSTSLETSTEDTSNSEKENAESEILPTEDVETVSEEQIPELVPKSEESMLKERATHVDEEKGTATKEISSAEKTEVQGGGDDVTSSQDASNEDIQETMIGQHNTAVTFFEEGQGVSATPKEILIEEADDKSIVAEEMPLELAQPSEQNVEEAHSSLSKIITENPEDDIKKEDKGLSHETVEDTNDDTTKEEKCTMEPEAVEEHSGLDEVSEEKVTDLNETTEVEPKEEKNIQKIDEASSEKAELEEGLKLSDSSNMKIDEKEITFIDDKEEKDQDVNMSTESQGEDNLTSSHIEVSEEKEDLKELNNHNEGNEGGFIKTGGVDEDTEEIKSSVDTKDQTTKHVTATNVCSSTQLETHEETTEHEEYEAVSREEDLEKKQEDVEETKMGEHAIINEEKDVCISTQNESQEEPTKNEENAIERDGDQKEKSKNAVVKEVCEEKDLTTTEAEGGQLSDSCEIKTREGVDEDTEGTKSSDETNENMEQQGLLNVITSDVCSSTQTEIIEKTTASEENNDVESIENNDGQTEKPASPLVEVLCEPTKSEIVESEEEVKQSDSFSTTLIENETLSKEEKLEKEDEIKTSGVQGGVDVTRSENASNEDIKEITSDQHNTTVEHVEEGHGVSALPKEILVEEAEDKSTDADKMLSELGQPTEQNYEETHPCVSKTISENPEEEIKKEDRDLSHESVECTLEHEPTEEHSAQDEVSKEKVTELNETTEVVEPQEDTPAIALETPTEYTSNSVKEKAEIENLPIEDLETVSEVQIPELVPKSEESVLIEECLISEKETHLDEDKGTIAEEISSDKKIEQTAEIKQETVKEVCEETSPEKTELEEGLKEKETITLKEDDQEKDQEVNTSAESQGVDSITSSKNEVSEEKEDLNEKNYHNEGNQGEFIESGEGVAEDTREFKPSVETKDKEHVITTNSSTQIQPDEETIEKDEKNDENEIVGREENLEKKQEDIKETKVGEHATTLAYNEEEQSPSTITKEVIDETEEGDKSVIAQEKTVQYDGGEKVEKEQKPEEHTDEIKPSVETNEEKDVCISTQIESHVEPTKNEENAVVKEACEEGDLTKTEAKERQHSDSTDDKTRECVDEDIEETKSSDETKENMEQQGLLNVTTTDISSSTQIQNVEKTTREENNNEEIIEHDKKPESPLVEVACEETRSEITESEEVVKQSDSFSTALNEKETLSKEEKLEKEDEIKTSEIEGAEVEVTSSHNASNDDIKETTTDQHNTTGAHVEEGQGVSVLPKEIIIEKTEDKSENEEKESKLEAENQADKMEYRTEMKDEAALTEKVSKELEQTKEQNVEETEACLTETISEKTEEKITKDEDVSHDSIEQINENITTEEKCLPDVTTKEINFSTLEHEPIEEQNDSQDEVSKEKFTDLNEPTAVEPQEDITPSGSLGTSAEDASNSDKAKAVSENLPIEDLESVSEVHIPEVLLKSEDSKMKEECLVSATQTYADEENRIVTKEISSDENLETHGSTQQPENSYSTTEENITQLEQSGETNSLSENRDMKEDVTQENQHNSTEDCSEIEKTVILTKEIEQVPLEIEKEKEISDFKEQTVEEDTYSPEFEEKSAQSQKETVHEISNSDSIPAEKPAVKDVNVDAQIGQDLQGKEDISCVSEATTFATVESVDLSNIESTAYPSESEKLATQAVDSDCDVQIPEVVADPEDSKVKEDCIVLATAENSVEEQDTKTNEISSASDKEQEIVTKVPTESDEAKSSDLIIEKKALTKENLEIHGELEPTSEPVIEEKQVTIETKPQPEQSDITPENVTNDQTSESKLEHTSAKDLEDEKGHTEEDVTLVPENETKGIENLHETTKNIILTDEVAVETEKEKEKDEIIGQVSEDDKCLTELDGTSTPDQKELANEQVEYSKPPIPVENTEVTEVKAESQKEIENIQAAEDLSCLSKASSVIETSKVEMHEDTEQAITVIEEVKDDSIDEATDKLVPTLEDSKTSELQVNFPKIESTETPTNSQESMKLREDVSCRTQETIEEQGALTSQLTDREILEEKDVKLISEDQKSINERCIEEKALGVEIKEAQSGNEAVEDVVINKVLLEDEKAKESKSIKDIINEEAKLTQLTSDTDVCQIERSSSRTDELHETKESVEDTEDAKFKAENLSVKDETTTEIKKTNEDSEIVASEFNRLEDMVTDKEKETIDEPHADDSEKTTYDSILSSTEQDVEVRSEESKDHGDMLKLQQNPTEDSEIATEAAKIVPKCSKTSAILTDDLPEGSPEMILAKPEDKIIEDREVLPSVDKDFIDVQKHEKDLDHENEVKIADVESNVECSGIEPRHLNKREATSDFINQENQKEQTKEADESIKDMIPVEDVKTSTKEPEVGSVDLEVPSITDATADKANNKMLEVHEAGGGLLKDDKHLESACDQSKSIEEGSGIKQEPLEVNAPGTLGTAATEDLKISQKYVPDEHTKVSQTHTETPKYDVPACTVDKQSPNEPQPKESTESKIFTEKIDSPGEPVARSLTPVAGNLKINTTVSVDQKEKDSALTKDQQVEKEETVKTDEEDDEEEDNEEDETMGSCSDAPVMVEASKDMEVKAHKKSHNILSGVGSKVKHSIAKVKKAITGKSSSPTKSTSPKAKNQVTGQQDK